MKLKRFIYIVAVCLMELLSLTIQARPMLMPSNVAISSDGTGELILKNTGTGITSYQTDVYLPNGITITDIALGDNSTDHQCLFESQADGAYRIIISSQTLAELPEQELTCQLSAPITNNVSGMAFLRNTVMVYTNGSKEQCTETTFDVADLSTDMTDMTHLLVNPNFTDDNTGWNGSGFTIGGQESNPCAETWDSSSFDVYQTLTGLPNGRYLVTCQGFYRAGGYADAANSRNNGTEEHYGYLYANNEQVALRSILDVGKEGLNYSSVGGWEPQATAYYDGGTYKLPNNMNAASYAFSNGVSLNKLEVNVTDGTLRIGIKKTGYIHADWVIFDDFHLYKIDGTAEETVKVGSISLSSSYLSMVVGNTTTLSASVSPSDATDKSLTWTSSAPSIATVNEAGVVTGVAVGTATITATANDGSGVSATCMVVVDTEKPCAKPVIAFAGGKITLSCSTPDAVCHYSYTITPTSGDGTGDASITPEIVITAYATANGYSQSASVTESFPLSGSDDLKGDVNGDGKLSIADANAIVNIVLGK